jgi:hypothetical protein
LRRRATAGKWLHGARGRLWQHEGGSENRPHGPLNDYRFVAPGVVTLGAAAEHNLELKSQGKAWSEVRLRRVRLVPAP